MDTVSKHFRAQDCKSSVMVVDDMRILEYRPCVLCFAEILHECTVVWRERPEEANTNLLVVKENVVEFVETFHKMVSNLNIELLDDDWLKMRLLKYDWTVQIYMSKLLTSEESYGQVRNVSFTLFVI